MSIADHSEIAADVERYGSWYHVLELPGGVVTPGYADVRPVAPTALPDSLEGRRCLDVGTFDGFWAFAMEARGGRVTALDVADPSQIDLPPETRERYERGELGDQTWGEGFRIARAALGSDVERVETSVYDLTPELIGGPVDFVLCGTLLQHLRDPIRGLERIRSVLAPGGEMVVVERVMKVPRRLRKRPYAEFRTRQGSQYTWWVASDLALEHWILTAGFSSVEHVGHHDLPEVSDDDRIAVVRAR
jgi:tRNA (mo5U34)-methyltransferase